MRANVHSHRPAGSGQDPAAGLPAWIASPAALCLTGERWRPTSVGPTCGLITDYRAEGVIYHVLRYCTPFTFKAIEIHNFLTCWNRRERRIRE